MSPKSYPGASRDLCNRSLAAELHAVTQTKMEVSSWDCWPQQWMMSETVLQDPALMAQFCNDFLKHLPLFFFHKIENEWMNEWWVGIYLLPVHAQCGSHGGCGPTQPPTQYPLLQENLLWGAGLTNALCPTSIMVWRPHLHVHIIHLHFSSASPAHLIPSWCLLLRRL